MLDQALYTPISPSRRVLLTCAMFGVCTHVTRSASSSTSTRSRRSQLNTRLLPHSTPRSSERSTIAIPQGVPDFVPKLAHDIHEALSHGAICLIQGPSGSGKSSVLRALAALHRANHERFRIVDSSRILKPGIALVDQVSTPLPRTIEIFAAAGITEPTLLIRPPEAISQGQRHRATLALALLRASLALTHSLSAARTPSTETTSNAEHPAVYTLIFDEFTSPLDPVWAAAVARALPRILARLRTFNPNERPRSSARSLACQLRVVVATSRLGLIIPGALRVTLPDPLAPRIGGAQ